MTDWVLVTGAARRIGRAIALEMARGGWNVVVHYRTSQPEAEQTAKDIRAMRREAVLAEIDLADLKAVEKLIPALTAEIGPITALVNNASIFEPDARAPEGDAMDRINAEAPRILSEALHRQGVKSSIVNLVDDSAPDTSFGLYNRSKRKLRDMTIEMAARFAPDIRVNGISPGPTLPGARQSPEHFQAQIDATPLRVSIPPEAIATGVRFLIENPAMTGDILHIDGGTHLRRPDGGR